MDNSNYHKYLPDLDLPRFQAMQKHEAHGYVREFKGTGNPPWLHALYMHWLELLQEPFKGITCDGKVQPGLFELQDDKIPIDNVVKATSELLSKLDEAQKGMLLYHVDSPEWRTWSNPEFLLSNKGLRLDEMETNVRDSVMKVLEVTLSPEGYEKAVSAMRINHFLGELVQANAICNEFSYNFVMFGTPSISRPWGFSFYGHHLCLNIFFYKSQIIISPWFTGAEPNIIDSGPYGGTRILNIEEKLGLELMQSLPPNLQARAHTYKLMKDPAMPPGRWNHDDQRHLCGAYRDNRVVPYEGVPVSELDKEQQGLVFGIFEQYLLYLPFKARANRLDLLRKHIDETFFSWIGGYGAEDPFYFRLQSPVIIVEFDHHSGVFLNNEQPAKFHIHTLMRTPNGGDYGYALRPLIAGIEQDFVWSGPKS